MRKIIFLDIDGVLNTERWHCQTASNELQDEYGYKFDPVAVTNLSKIIEETGADIVISSSWKFMGLSKMRKMWKDRKLPGNVIGITPNTVSDKFLLNVDLDNMDIMAIRGQEVKEWLMLNKNEITNKNDVTLSSITNTMYRPEINNQKKDISNEGLSCEILISNESKKSLTCFVKVSDVNLLTSNTFNPDNNFDLILNTTNVSVEGKEAKYFSSAST